MIKDIVARRYAKALFSITKNEKEAETVKKEIESLSNLIEANREIKNLVFNPMYGKEDKEKILTAILQKTKSSDTTKNFIRLLLKKDRIKNLREVAEGLSDLIIEKQNKKKAVVISIEKLPEASLSKIRSRLSGITKKDIEIEERVDSSIIGGVIIQVGSLVYNGSIKTQLESVKNRLLLKR